MWNGALIEHDFVASTPQTIPTPERVAELERLGDEIALLAAHLDAATARLLGLIREFDARAGWNNGHRSCAEWLSWRVGLDLGAARERVRVARALGSLPRLAQALARGELSYSKVRALTRVATPETEERLLAVGRAGTASHVERIVRGWRLVDRKAEAREADKQHASRELWMYPDSDGMVLIRGRLTPEVGALLTQALAAARETLYQRRRRNEDEGASSAQTEGASSAPAAGGPSARVGGLQAGMPATQSEHQAPPAAQQQADALALLAETALHHGFDPGTSGERYQIVVHVDAEVLADAEDPGQSALEDGTRVSAETSQRLACDASRVVMRHDPEGRLLEVGARTRTIPPALRRALQYRDRGCRFPGCPVRFGQGHHILHWAQGGPTTLSNLAMLCRRHHRAVHEEGFQLERLSSGELRFTSPDGRVVPDVPPSPEVSDAAAGMIRWRNEANGLHLQADTAKPGWCGERLDLGYAIDVLHPRANPLTPA
jgi:hypothetical protein